MYPVLWETPYFTIHSYGLMISLGILVCSFLLLREAAKHGYNSDYILEVIIILGVSGLIGSRVLFVILNLGYYSEDWSRVFDFRSGGLSFYGAVAFGIIFSLLWSRWRKFSYFKLTDFLAPYLLLGYAFGRVGCYLNGCCYGKTTEYYTEMPVAFMDTLLRHPVQLYAGAGSLLLFLAVLFLRKYSYYNGFNLTLLLMFYGVLRFVTGFLREDDMLWLNLSLAQVFSLGLTAAMIIAMLLIYKIKKLQNADPVKNE